MLQSSALHLTVLNCSILRRIVWCWAAVHYTGLCYYIMRCTALFPAVPYCASLHSTEQHSTAQHGTVSHLSALYCADLRLAAICYSINHSAWMRTPTAVQFMFEISGKGGTGYLVIMEAAKKQTSKLALGGVIK